MLRRTLILFALIASPGCMSAQHQSATTQDAVAPDRSERVVKVFLYPDGHFESDRTIVSKDEVKRFAGEVGNRSVSILAVGSNGQQVTFAQAADLRDSLKNAGVKEVTIAMEGE